MQEQKQLENSQSIFICAGYLKNLYSTGNCPLCISQRDVRSDPKDIQEVSAATDNLLESLGALAVEVNTPPMYTDNATPPC